MTRGLIDVSELSGQPLIRFAGRFCSWASIMNLIQDEMNLDAESNYSYRIGSRFRNLTGVLDSMTRGRSDAWQVRWHRIRCSGLRTQMILLGIDSGLY